MCLVGFPRRTIQKILRPWISSMTLADCRVYHQNYTLAIYDTVIYRGYTISQ